MTDSAGVPFAGTRGGQGPMTWGQRSIWRITAWLPPGDPYFNMPWTLPVHGKPDLPTVLAALGRMIGRHESLRTTFTDGPAGLTQRVRQRGELTVRLVDAGDARPRALAQEIAADLAATGFEYAAEPPLRCAVVMGGGRPRALAFAFSHLAVDAGALDVLAGEWPRLLAGESLPEPRPQPLDLAVEELSPDGRALGERALRHWRAALERTPRPLFPAPTATPEDPRFVKLGLESAALARAATTLAERWSVSTSGVLLGAYAMLLARHTGHDVAAMQVIVGNRHDPRLAPMVGTLVQDGILVLDVAGLALAEVVRAANRGVLTTYRRARYEPMAQQALIAELGPPPMAYFNDVRTTTGWPNTPQRPGPTRVLDVGAWPEVDAEVFFTVGPATHTCRLDLLADTAHLPRATIEATLREIETLLVNEEKL